MVIAKKYKNTVASLCKMVVVGVWVFKGPKNVGHETFSQQEIKEVFPLLNAELVLQPLMA